MTTIARTREQLALARPPDRTIAVVMTMGALHDGHLSLIDVAQREVGQGGCVVVTIFVNPAQFGANEDLSAYPRTEEADLEACRRRGVDVVYLPSVADVYGPHGQFLADQDTASVTIDPGPLGSLWEGQQRPGHFRGVLTVVAKLLHLTRADVAVFGEKDYQQLTLIRAMVAALDFPTKIVAGPTAREPDGLAMSSRNRYLSQEQRTQASQFAAALSEGVRAANQGATADGVAAVTLERLHQVPDLQVDYVEVRSPDLREPPVHGQARLIAAVRVGQTRLLDNRALILQEVA